MSTEPKLGTCDETSDSLTHGCPYSDAPHYRNKFCIHWREGESAAAQPCIDCGQPESDKAHDPDCPSIIDRHKFEAVPPAAETAKHKPHESKPAIYCVDCQALYFDDKWYSIETLSAERRQPMNAEQDIQQVLDFYNNWHDHSDDFTPDRDTVGLVLAYAAHVREAAQGETAIDLDELRNHIAEQNTQLARIAAALKIDFISAKYVAEAAERKLAELEKALRDLINEFQLHLPNIKERESLALSAALASLRAESKEPVD